MFKMASIFKKKIFVKLLLNSHNTHFFLSSIKGETVNKKDIKADCNENRFWQRAIISDTFFVTWSNEKQHPSPMGQAYLPWIEVLTKLLNLKLQD